MNIPQIKPGIIAVSRDCFPIGLSISRREAMELVPENFTCPHCGGKEFDKETDTLD